MDIRTVSIREYRNIEKMDIQLSPRANLFIGNNGQGKTNFLEAVFFALRGYSFRTTNNRDLIRKSAQEKKELTRVSMDIHRDRISHKINAIILDQKKMLKINDKPATSVKLLTEFPLVFFSPDSLAAIKSGPEERRELMNEMLVLGNPQNHRIINDYTKALRTRNRFLKDSMDIQKINFELLGALSETLFGLAIELIEARRSILTQLEPHFVKTAKKILNEPTVDIRLGYSMSDEDVSSFSRGEIEDKLHQRRFELYDAELSSGTTLWGPHKHDLMVTYGGNSARFFCSQGQQRTLILALKISQIVQHFEAYGKFPLLLLDDVFSELDQERRSYLLDFLSELKTQSILTCTDVQHMRGLGFFDSVVEVSNGRGALVRTKSVGGSIEGLFG